MSISDLYSSGFRDRNRDHFAAIVRVALSDGEMSPEEKAFLDRLANEDEMRIMRRLGIGLGFNPANVDLINKKAMDLIHKGVDLDTFIEEIKHMNR